jgi:hypothetical protein
VDDQWDGAWSWVLGAGIFVKQQATKQTSKEGQEARGDRRGAASPKFMGGRACPAHVARRRWTVEKKKTLKKPLSNNVCPATDMNEYCRLQSTTGRQSNTMILLRFETIHTSSTVSAVTHIQRSLFARLFYLVRLIREMTLSTLLLVESLSRGSCSTFKG